MRILFASLASRGHMYPLIPLAQAARDAGHDVVFASAASMHPTLRSAGLQAVDSGIGIRDAFLQATTEMYGSPDKMPPDARPLVIGRVFGSLLPRTNARSLVPILERVRPELVVQEVGDPGAGLAATKCGIPFVRHSFGRGSIGSPFGSTAEGGLQDVATELGVELNGLARPCLDIYPPSLQDPEFAATVARHPLRPVAHAEPGPLPPIVTADDARPLVYLTLGTAFGSSAVLRIAIDGLASLAVRVLVAVGPTVDAADLGELPDNVDVEEWVAQADVLPYLDLVVHHGGSGTTLGALAAGVPQLFMPQGADQFVNADAVSATPAGDVVPVDFDADVVAAKAHALLTSENSTAAARELAREIAAMPSPDEVARQLPTFV